MYEILFSMEKPMILQFLRGLLNDLQNNERNVDLMINIIEHEVFKYMTTLHSVPIDIGTKYFEIGDFSDLRYSFKIEYEYGDISIFDEYFVGTEYVYHIYLNNTLYRVSVYFDKNENKYKDVIDVSFLGECPEWLNKYKDNVYDDCYK